MESDVRWGLVATVKAPDDDVLAFAAHHIDLGAQRLYLYLDAPDADTPSAAAQSKLKAHPKVRVIPCTKAYWKQRSGKPPVKHQVRQSRNATHAYSRPAEVDWLIHIDVDEFLLPENGSIADHLAALPIHDFCARVRPDEQLSGDGTAYKRFIPAGPDRASRVAVLYPRFGALLKGGFLSHVAGKLFVRTGNTGIELRIHNAFQGALMNPGETDLVNVALLHRHATSWDDWRARFDYRLDKGAYRADLAPAQANGTTLHDALQKIVEGDGETGLQDFFDEVAADSPALRSRLAESGLLRICDLNLAAKIAKHFGGK